MKYALGIGLLFLLAAPSWAELDPPSERDTQQGRPSRSLPLPAEQERRLQELLRKVKQLPANQRAMIEEYFRRNGQLTPGQASGDRW